jgi:hypothetical protein
MEFIDLAKHMRTFGTGRSKNTSCSNDPGSIIMLIQDIRFFYMLRKNKDITLKYIKEI